MPIVVPYPENAIAPEGRTELQIHRINTEVFIRADPVEITLFRSVRERQLDGGFLLIRNTLPSQIFRMLPVTDRPGDIKISTGRRIAPAYTLLGVWDCDMKRDDNFVFDGVEYTIGSVRPEHTHSAYYRKGDVVRRG